MPWQSLLFIAYTTSLATLPLMGQNLRQLDDLVDIPLPPSTVTFSSFLNGELHDRESTLAQLLAKRNYPKDLNLIPPKESSGTPISSQSGEWIFKIANIPLCEYALKVSPTATGDNLILGLVPQRFVIPPLEAWPEKTAALLHASHRFKKIMGFTRIEALNSKKCYVVRRNTLKPTWVFTLAKDKLRFKIIADTQQIFSTEPMQFHTTTATATATAKIYPHNILDSITEEFQLFDMDAAGKLSNPRFYTEIDPSSQMVEALSSNSIFAFDTSTSEFAQTSVFTNANRIFDWYKSLGTTFADEHPIKLQVHAVIQGDSNNALYQPSSTGESTIYVGDGDGIILKNLATDADVVSHEFGHHVVYSSLKSIKGESLVLHEGLADFFTFSWTGNACLGESICPPGSPIHCAIDAKCLRTAENDFQYGASDLPKEPHFRSQFISGFLWDLREKDAIDSTNLSKLVLLAISYLASSSGYRDLVLSLLHADSALNNRSNCLTILARAEARGMGELLSDVDCSLDDYPNINSAQDQSITGGGGKSGGSKTCGGLGNLPANQQGLVGLLMLLPFMFAVNIRGGQ